MIKRKLKAQITKTAMIKRSLVLGAKVGLLVCEPSHVGISQDAQNEPICYVKHKNSKQAG